jgi:hypothetical protein
MYTHTHTHLLEGFDCIKLSILVQFVQGKLFLLFLAPVRVNRTDRKRKKGFVRMDRNLCQPHTAFETPTLVVGYLAE